jgi:hypothetical protein
MKISTIAKACLTLSFVLLFACAGSRQGATVDFTADTENQQKGQIEELDPMTLGDLRLVDPTEKEEKMQPADLDQLLKGDEGLTDIGPEEIQGYRVQLIATRDEEEARSVKRDALISFDERVYLVYDNPYYKVRIGDCLSRYEADTLQEKAVQKSFVEAWVVRTTVSVTPQDGDSGTETSP